MKNLTIGIVSDLHLDISKNLDLPGGEVLILAGDICEYRNLIFEFHESNKLDCTHAETFHCLNFFKIECAKYEKVFMVMGNHEHYRYRFNKTYNDLKAILPDNVTLLENETVEYKGVMFMGATLWTDLNKGDPITAYTVKDGMNDYKAIQNFYPEKSLYHKLTPQHTAEVHFKTKQYFKMMLEEHRDKPFVVITHHAPSHLSINEKYKNDYHMNGGYVSDLSEFILDYPNIKWWYHGHMHDPVDYMVGDTRIVANPRGYVPWESGNGFNPNLTFEI